MPKQKAKQLFQQLNSNFSSIARTKKAKPFQTRNESAKLVITDTDIQTVCKVGKKKKKFQKYYRNAENFERKLKLIQEHTNTVKQSETQNEQ